MQPGVFGLSSWDLVGALPIPEQEVADRTKDGDYRWINRGAVNLMGANPGAVRSPFGLPMAHALYGPLPRQLRSPDSFASRIKQMLAARQRYRIPEAEVAAVPYVRDRAVCALVMRLPHSEALAVTLLNYGRDEAAVDLDLGNVPWISAERVRGQTAFDIVAGRAAGAVSDAGRLTIRVDALSGLTVVLGGR